MSRGVVHDACTGSISGILLDFSVQGSLQAFDLVVHAFAGVAVAIVIRRGGDHADILKIFNSGYILMAEGAFFDLDLEGVRVMTANTSVIAFDVIVLGVVGHAFIFVTAMRHATIQSCGSGIVMDVTEAKGYIIALVILDRGHHSIHVSDLEALDLRIHADLGFASLVTFHTTGVIPGCDLHTRGEHDRRLGQSDCVMTRCTLDALGVGCWDGCIHFASFRAISTEEILITGAGMALGARSGHFGWIFSIPVAEGFASHISVTGTLPFSQERGIGNRSYGSFFRRGFCFCFGGCCFCAAACR